VTKSSTALVIGCGIAGPAAAVALQKAGISSVVYEQYPGSAPEVGSFLTLATNGVDALRTLDADKAATSVGFQTTGIVLWSGTGKRLGTAEVSMTLPDGTTGYTMKRGDLYSALRTTAELHGIRVEGTKQLVGVAEVGAGVRADFSDGSRADADILVGCDGAYSTVRGAIDSNAPAPKYAGLVNLGGFVRGVPVDAAPGTYHMIFGKQAFFGFAVAPDGEVWWFANVPQATEPERGSLALISGDVWRQQLRELFADDAGPAVPLIEATSHELRANAVHTLGHLPRWHTDRMVVMGDAAHAPSPSSGQGASLAIEDAVELAKDLRDLPGPAEAFAAFERARRPRVERVIKQAARVNNSKAATGAGRALRDAMLPVVLKLVANTKHSRQLYGHHIDWDRG
jgi:2-polyprenyl-6-methoxyphenol hydroxylase-like FAD-dependent oxidoreductase